MSIPVERARMFRMKKREVIATLSVVALIVLVSCSGGNPPDDSSNMPSDPAGSCFAFRQYGNLQGKSVTVYTSILSPEDQSHIDSFKPFEKCTGAKINYEGSHEFESQLPLKIEAGSSPDIAYLPQPGLLKTLLARHSGKIKEVSGQALSNLEENYRQAWKDYGSADGKVYAVPVGASVKSFVWYSPKTFTDNGYQVPKTWDDLMILTEKISSDHPDAKPWCAGIESGSSTGWPATDWLEDTMLRTAGPDAYDQWVTHQIPFNDPKVVTALDQAGGILKNDAYVNGGLGGIRSIRTTAVGEAGLPVLEGTCFLHHQASFYQVNWPAGTKIAEDGDVFAFYLPGSTETDRPVLVGGEFAAAFSDREEVKAFQAYLTSPEFSNAKAQATGPGWVSANRKLDPANLSSPVDRLSYQLISDENNVLRFDGSDQMPGTVGTGTFWTGMTDWISLNKSSQDILTEIENSWPDK